MAGILRPMSRWLLSPTTGRVWRFLLASLAVLAGTWGGTVRANEPTAVVLDVPFRSQFDGTPWGSSNCGPAALAMVLSAFGVRQPVMSLRARADQLLGFADPEQGTRLQDLARIATESGLTVTGPYDSAPKGKPTFRRWTLDDTRAQLQRGRPLVIETYYPLLPNHMTKPVDTDHCIVLVGLEGQDFVFNDPANNLWPGFRVHISAAALTRAWGNSDFPFGGFAVGPGPDTRVLQPHVAERELPPWQAVYPYRRPPRAE